MLKDHRFDFEHDDDDGQSRFDQKLNRLFFKFFPQIFIILSIGDVGNCQGCRRRI